MGKNKKPMLTVLVEERKLQRFRDYASSQGMSMGAVINQLIDQLLPEELDITSIDNSQISPLALSLQDIDRLIKSAILSATEANNGVVAELKSMIEQQGIEISRFNEILYDLQQITYK